MVCSPLLANEYSSKGSYVTGSIGGSQIGDIDVVGINSNIEFESGLGLDLGYGYDFGKTRIEGNWVRGQSDKTSWLGYSIKTDSTIDSYIASIYYDFVKVKSGVLFLVLPLAVQLLI